MFKTRSPNGRIGACIPADGSPGFSTLSLASNHVLDFGDEGLRETQHALERMNIPRNGAGWTRLGRWVVTPEYHRLHHDRDEIRDKNFGAIFTIWDRVFGTYLDPALYPEARPVGLDDFKGASVRTVLGI